jgi:hypothetical protein
MKTYPGIDYEFRPASYWEEGDPLAILLRNVKGSNRRRMIIDYWRAGRLDEIEETLLQEELDDDQRARLGRIHPSFMGGEYLPGYEAQEVEIVRVELQSTLGDVISLRARPVPEGIAYRVVDEYEAAYSLPLTTSEEPLSLRELIALCDGARLDEADNFRGGLALGFNVGDDHATRRRYRHFTHVSSPFYPQLEAHFEHVFDDWVAESADTSRDAPVTAPDDGGQSPGREQSDEDIEEAKRILNAVDGQCGRTVGPACLSTDQKAKIIAAFLSELKDGMGGEKGRTG